MTRNNFAFFSVLQVRINNEKRREKVFVQGEEGIMGIRERERERKEFSVDLFGSFWFLDLNIQDFIK